MPDPLVAIVSEIIKAGTSEGAKKGWEKRKRGAVSPVEGGKIDWEVTHPITGEKTIVRAAADKRPMTTMINHVGLSRHKRTGGPTAIVSTGGVSNMYPQRELHALISHTQPHTTLAMSEDRGILRELAKHHGLKVAEDTADTRPYSEERHQAHIEDAARYGPGSLQADDLFDYEVKHHKVIPEAKLTSFWPENKSGTSEGAKEGWEHRQHGGAHQEWVAAQHSKYPLTMAEKDQGRERIMQRVGTRAEDLGDPSWEFDRYLKKYGKNIKPRKLLMLHAAATEFGMHGLADKFAEHAHKLANGEFVKKSEVDDDDDSLDMPRMGKAEDTEENVEASEQNYDNLKKIKKTGQDMSEEEGLAKSGTSEGAEKGWETRKKFDDKPGTGPIGARLIQSHLNNAVHSLVQADAARPVPKDIIERIDLANRHLGSNDKLANHHMRTARLDLQEHINDNPADNEHARAAEEALSKAIDHHDKIKSAWQGWKSLADGEADFDEPISFNRLADAFAESVVKSLGADESDARMAFASEMCEVLGEGHWPVVELPGGEILFDNNNPDWEAAVRKSVQAATQSLSVLVEKAGTTEGAKKGWKTRRYGGQTSAINVKNHLKEMPKNRAQIAVKKVMMRTELNKLMRDPHLGGKFKANLQQAMGQLNQINAVGDAPIRGKEKAAITATFQQLSSLMDAAQGKMPLTEPVPAKKAPPAAAKAPPKKKFEQISPDEPTAHPKVPAAPPDKNSGKHSLTDKEQAYMKTPEAQGLLKEANAKPHALTEGELQSNQEKNKQAYESAKQGPGKAPPPAAAKPSVEATQPMKPVAKPATPNPTGQAMTNAKPTQAAVDQLASKKPAAKPSPSDVRLNKLAASGGPAKAPAAAAAPAKTAPTAQAAPAKPAAPPPAKTAAPAEKNPAATAPAQQAAPQNPAAAAQAPAAKKQGGILQRAASWLSQSEGKVDAAVDMLAGAAKQFAQHISGNIQYRMAYNQWSSSQSKAKKLHDIVVKEGEQRTESGIPPRSFYDHAAQFKKWQDDADAKRGNFYKMLKQTQMAKSMASEPVLPDLASPYPDWD